MSRSASASATSTPTATEAEAFKEVAEHVEDIADILEASTSVTTSRNTFVAMAVIASPLVRIAEHFKRLSRLLEAIDGRLIARISIRVIRQSQLLVSLLDLIITGGLRNRQHFVVTAF